MCWANYFAHRWRSGRCRATNFAHRTQKHGDIETNNTTARPQQGTAETDVTSAPKNCTKNAHFSPAKPVAVSIPRRHKRAKAVEVSVEAQPARAKATGVSHHRATWPAPLFVPTTTMCPKRRPPRPKHPDFAHFHRGGPQFGRITPQHRAIGGRRRDLPRCRWAVAGPGRATRRHPDRLEAAARPAGPGRASRRRAERSSQRGRRAGGQAARRPEICRGRKRQQQELLAREAVDFMHDEAAHGAHPCDGCDAKDA